MVDCKVNALQGRSSCGIKSLVADFISQSNFFQRLHCWTWCVSATRDFLSVEPVSQSQMNFAANHQMSKFMLLNSLQSRTALSPGPKSYGPRLFQDGLSRQKRP